MLHVVWFRAFQKALLERASALVTRWNLVIGVEELQPVQHSQMHKSLHDAHGRALAIKSGMVCETCVLCSQCRLKHVNHGELELDVQWFSILDKQPSH